MNYMRLLLVNYFISFVYMQFGNKMAEANPYCVDTIQYSSNIRNITNHNYIEAFKEGPCSPIILIPGYMGTKLEFVMEDSKLFRESHPEIIEKCGWKDLSNKELSKFNLWINVEATNIEETIFGKSKKAKSKEHIPLLFKNIKFMDFDIKYEQKPGCYGSLMRHYFTIDDKGEVHFSELKGAKIRPVVYDKSSCGSDSISNLLSTYSSFVKYSLNFQGILKTLEKLGYKNGLSLFSFPYDWRFPLNHHQEKLNKTINLSYALTKKKSIVISHSFGSILSYDLASKRGEMIEEVISIGAAFLGSAKSLEIFFDYHKLFDVSKEINLFGMEGKIEGGLDMESILVMQATNLNKFHFLPKKRIRDEVDDNIRSSVKKIFPTESQREQCKSTIEYLNEKTVCDIHFNDNYDHSMLSMDQEDKYFTEEDDILDYVLEHKFYNLAHIMNYESDNKLPLHKLERLLYNKIKKESITDYSKIPQTKYTFIYSAHLPTTSRVEISKNNKGKVKIDKVVNAKPGDGTVDAISQIYPGLRWISEKEMKKESLNKHPIHFVEYCAFSKEFSLGNTFNNDKTQYITLPCDCLVTKNMDPVEECNHATMLNDKYVTGYIEKVIKSTTSKQILIPEYKRLYEKPFDKSLVCKNLFR